MSEIEVGEYIRDKNGHITKIYKCLGKDVGYKNMRHYKADDLIPGRGFIVYEEDIKSHSKNIIDLIEKGDIVNNERVKRIHKGIGQQYIVLEESNIFSEDYKDIKSILTHEQYKANCYKVGK